MDFVSFEEEMEAAFEQELKNIGVNLIEDKAVQKLEQIGEGSFGKVYKGKYNNVIVAIKKIKLKEKEPEIFQSLLNEIKVIFKANNPEIPKFFGIAKRKGKYCLISEYIPGKPLKDIYEHMSTKEKLKVIFDLCTILEDFHSKNLIHRDIKPANILVCPGDKTKLIDFGVSKIASHTVTYTKSQEGTTPYMSPEQFQIDIDKYDDPNVEDIRPVQISTKSDIWSLGVMISEIFSGVKPYYNLTKRLTKPNDLLITKRLSDNSPFPVPDCLADDIKYIVVKATNLNFEERPTASEIKEYIGKLLLNK